MIVGRVESVRLDPKTYEARGDAASIDNGYQFSKDTIASILTSGLLGEVYIGLEAGGDPVMLADGGRIAKTQSAVVLEKLISQFLFDKASSGARQVSTPASAPRRLPPRWCCPAARVRRAGRTIRSRRATA